VLKECILVAFWNGDKPAGNAWTESCFLAMATLTYNCKYCGKPFRTSSGERRHVQQTQSCLTHWREELGQFSINVFDLNEDDIPRHHGTVNIDSSIDSDGSDGIPDTVEWDIYSNGPSDVFGVVDNTLGNVTDTCQVDTS
jgi:hypothetical protein